jgi:hypothetical protein
MKINGRVFPAISISCTPAAIAAEISGHVRPSIFLAFTGAAMPKEGKVTKRVRALKLMAGVTEAFPVNETVPVASKKLSAAELIEAAKAHIDALDAVDRSHAVFKQAVHDEAKLARQMSRVLKAVKAWVLGVRGPRPDLLAAFGFDVPKAPGPKTAKAKAKQVERAHKTREAKKAALAQVKRGKS